MSDLLIATVARTLGEEGIGPSLRRQRANRTGRAEWDSGFHASRVHDIKSIVSSDDWPSVRRSSHLPAWFTDIKWAIRSQ